MVYHIGAHPGGMKLQKTRMRDIFQKKNYFLPYMKVFPTPQISGNEGYIY